jgi:hypothetical protein
VIAFSMLAMLALTAPSGASQSCTGKTGAHRHFGSVHTYRDGPDYCWNAIPIRGHHQINDAQCTFDQPMGYDSTSEMLPDVLVQNPWVARLANIERSQQDIVARQVYIVQMAPPRSVVLVVIAIVLTLGTIEVLFRCTIL